jgi:hypothetical protein
MSDTNEMEVGEDWAGEQESSDFSGVDGSAEATGDWGAEQTQGWDTSTGQDQGWETGQDQQGWDTSTGQDQQGWETGQDQQGWDTSTGQDQQGWETGAGQDQQGWDTSTDQGWNTGQESATGDGQDWAGDQGQMAAMYAPGQQPGGAPAGGAGSGAPTPMGGGSQAVQVEFVSGPALDGNGFTVEVRNIGKSTIPKFTDFGTWTVFKKEGTQAHPQQTLSSALDLPAGGTTVTGADLESIPGPVTPLPDGAYRVRVRVGIVERELSYKKHLGKLQP